MSACNCKRIWRIQACGKYKKLMGQVKYHLLGEEEEFGVRNFLSVWRRSMFGRQTRLAWGSSAQYCKFCVYSIYIDYIHVKLCDLHRGCHGIP